MEIPQRFLESMQRLLNEEYPAFLACYDQPPVAGLRANTLKVSPQELRQRLNFELAPLPGIPAGFRLEQGPGSAHFLPGRHPYHAAGLYYLQEPSAMAVAELLAPQPGELVLDLCAAPGGKSTHLAALMQNQGVLVANETHPRRVWELAENLERCGVRNAAIINETPQRLAQRLGPVFDRVLVDAPCSGEGMFRKSEAARQEWNPEAGQSCALRQTSILEEAAALLRPGGWLAYSTCTFNPQENETVIARLLAAHPEFELVEANLAIPGKAQGRPDWAAPGFQHASLEKALRLWPHRVVGEGHFMALLRKSATGMGSSKPRTSSQGRSMTRKGSLEHITPPEKQAFQAFVETVLHNSQADEILAGGRLHLAGSYLYLIPPEMPDWKGLHTIHPGWWLGSLKTGQFGQRPRFEPAHALAMGIQAGDCRQTVDLSVDAPETLAYLRGETLRREGSEGWNLVTVDGFSLGWGKYSHGALKNDYPRGIRWP